MRGGRGEYKGVGGWEEEELGGWGVQEGGEGGGGVRVWVGRSGRFCAYLECHFRMSGKCNAIRSVGQDRPTVIVSLNDAS